MQLRRESEAPKVKSTVAPEQATAAEQTQETGAQNAEDRIAELKSTNTNLGEVEGLNAATAAVGAIIDALIPRDGDKADLSISFDIPVHPLVKLNFGFFGMAIRTGDQAMLIANLSMGAKLEGTVGPKWLELKAYLGVSGKGYIKTMGDSAEEAFAFMGLGAREIVAMHSEKVAGFMMSKKDRESVIGLMSDNEFAELGLGVEVSAGASFSNDIDKDNSNVTGVGVSAGYQKGIKFSDKDNDGNLELTDTAMMNAKIKADINFEKLGLKNTSGGASVAVNMAYTNGDVSGIWATFGVDGSVEAKNFDLSFLAECFSGMTIEMIKIMAQGAEYFSGKGARLMGQIAASATNLSLADNVTARLVNMADIPVGVKSKPTFQVFLRWKPGGECSLDLKLTTKVSTEVDAGIAKVSAGLSDTVMNLKLPFKV